MRLQLPFSGILLKRRPSSAALSPLCAAPPPRLTAPQQWARLTSVLESAISSAGAATHRQTAAHQQLDLAQYALYTLGDELSAVMTIPGRREPASVHVLEAPSPVNGAAALAA